MKKFLWEMSSIAAVLAVAFLALGTTACTGVSQASQGEAAEEEPEQEAVPVETVALGTGPIEEVLRYSTTLEAESAVGVYSQAARQVTSLQVEEGDRVRKGQLLLRLQDDEQRTQIAKVQGQISKAQREYDRQKRLFQQELISEQAYNEATYELEQLKIDLQVAQQELSYTEVRAPISGTITNRLVNLGDFITLNQHLFDLVDFDSIVARVYVPEKELGKIGRGKEARITAPALGDAAYSGSIERLAPIVDPKSGTVKVTVAIPRNSELRPGMYVDVQLVTAVHADAVLVPKRALVYDNDQIFVYRMADEDRVERVLIRPVLEAKNFIEPTAELAAGDEIVVAGQAGLKDGALVRQPGAGA